VFKTVIKLDGPSGTAKLPAQKSLGKYKYRLAALEGKTVIAKQAVTIGVFGEVPLSILLGRGHEKPSVVTTPVSSFPYVGEIYSPDTGQESTAFSVKDNHCSSAHIEFVLTTTPGEGYSYPASMFSIVSVVQQTREPVRMEVAFKSSGSVSAELTPGQTWSMTVKGANREGALGNPTIYYNGYAICDSTEPF
jgi:hypothetical protein